jgi:phage host-nuclease inhibitor protein Gam
MDPETNETAAPTNNSAEEQSTTNRLAQATNSLAEALVNINAQFESLHAKVDRIVAAVSNENTETGDTKKCACQASAMAELEKNNRDLKAQAARAQRKTLSPLVTTLLAKEGVEGEALIETSVVEKALAGLSIEQRIAVKAELARAGILV